MTIKVRSRVGNAVLACLGATYAAAAALLLARFIGEHWGANIGSAEMLVAMTLLGALAGGAWLLNCALRARRTTSAAAA